jgi:hypothetical protein
MTSIGSLSEDSPGLPTWEELFDEQVKTYAADAPSSTSTTPETTSDPGLMSGYEMSGYDTDRTDFLPYAETPCPRRVQKQLRKAEESSHFFMKNKHNKPKATPIARRLWGTATRKPTNQRKSENDKLRDIERTPPHKVMSLP